MISTSLSLLYIDSGSGSILIQMIIAGLASTLVFWSRIKKYVISIFKRIFKKE